MKKIIFIFCIIAVSVSGQTKDPQVILDKVKQKFSTVKDYSVDAHIKVDVDFIKVPEMDAKVYFKQPDKMKLDSKGFAMLPRQAFNFSPNTFLQNKHTPVYTGAEKLNGKNVDVLRIIPSSDSSEVVMTTLWIDQANSIVRKIESTSRKGGTFQIELSYNNTSGYPLPSNIKFTFDLPDMGGRRGIAQSSGDKEEKKSDKPGRGVVKIDYKGYKVNQGLSDDIFKETKKK